VTGELERLAAACLLPGFPGLEPPDWLRRRLAHGLRGVVLFGRNVADDEQVSRLTGALRAERPDVLVAIDEEGGDVTRLEVAEGSSYPGNAALGAVDDVELTAEVAAAMAGELAARGIDLDLAPVADVNSNPGNPVIGSVPSAPTRSSSRVTWRRSSRACKRWVWPRARSTSRDTAPPSSTPISSSRSSRAGGPSSRRRSSLSARRSAPASRRS
jgi:hypothetical protein